MAFYIYAVDEQEKSSQGRVTESALNEPPTTPLTEIKTLTHGRCSPRSRSRRGRAPARYNLLAIPVVDENKLLGIVTIDDVIDVIREEATEDILKMAGADETAYEDTSAWSNFRTLRTLALRDLDGGACCRFNRLKYEHQLQEQVAFAAFIPIVLGMGNVGSQTATIIVRGLATGRVEYGLRKVPR